MWFKNIFIFRIATDNSITSDKLNEKLALKPLLPCSGLDKQRRGWVTCHADKLVFSANKQILFALGVEQKLLPSTIINRFTKERVADIEEQQGYKVGRKELKELKEAITEELLPRAFALQRTTYAWLDPVNGYLIIDAASSARTEELLELINKTLDALPFSPLHTAISPVTAMTDWLAGTNAPACFTAYSYLKEPLITTAKRPPVTVSKRPLITITKKPLPILNQAVAFLSGLPNS